MISKFIHKVLLIYYITFLSNPINVGYERIHPKKKTSAPYILIRDNVNINIVHKSTKQLSFYKSILLI